MTADEALDLVTTIDTANEGEPPDEVVILSSVSPFRVVTRHGTEYRRYLVSSETTVTPVNDHWTPAEIIALHWTCSCGESAENAEENAAHVVDELAKAGYLIVRVS